MRVEIGNNKIAANISQVRLNTDGASTKITVNVDVLFGELQAHWRPDSAGYTLNIFAAAVFGQGMCQQIYSMNGAIIPYLKKKKVGTGIYLEKRSLTLLNNPNSSASAHDGVTSTPRTFQIEVPYKIDEDMAIFAGIYLASSGMRQSIRLLSFDTVTARENGKVPSTAVVLYTDKGKTAAFLGPATQQFNNKWFAADGSGIELHPQSVPNTKIIDETSSALPIAPSIRSTLEKFYLLNSHTRTPAELHNKLKQQTTTYFSPLYTSKLEDNNVGLLFAFNRYEYFKNNGLFSHLINNKQEVLSSFSITSARFLRKRVVNDRPISQLTGGGGASKDFDTTEVRLKYEATYVDLGGGPDVLMLAATDASFNDVTYGIYSYGIEFTMVDHTADKIRDILHNPKLGLFTQIKRLGAFYEKMRTPQNYNSASKRLTDACLAAFSARRITRVGSSAINSYLSALKAFNSSLSVEALKKELINLTDVIINGPDGVLRLQKLLVDLAAQINTFLITSNQRSNGDPSIVETSASSIGAQTRILKLRFYFNEFVDADDFLDFGYDYLETSKKDFKSTTIDPFKVINYKKMQDLLVAEASKTSSGVVAQAGKGTININKNTVAYLTPNFLKMGDQRHVLNTKQPTQTSITRQAAVLLATANLVKSSPPDFAARKAPAAPMGISDDRIQLLSNLITMMGTNNCEIEIEKETIAPDCEPPSPASTNMFAGIVSTDVALSYPGSGAAHLDAAAKLSEESPFVINRKGSDSLGNFVAARDQGDPAAARVKEISKLDLDVLYNLVQSDFFVGRVAQGKTESIGITAGNVFRSNNYTVDTIYQQSLQEAASGPSQKRRSSFIDALVNKKEKEVTSQQELNYANELQKPLRAQELPRMAFQYGMIRKCQYLSGFKTQNSSVQLRSPTWLDLTSDMLDQFLATGTTLLCRLVTKDSSFKQFDGIAGPVYNNMFIVSPSSTLKVPRKTQKTMRQIARSSSRRSSEQSPKALITGRYSRALLADTSYNSRIEPGLATTPTKGRKKAKNKTKNLYTYGRDYKLPNGRRYTGPYHLVMRKEEAIAMVGPQYLPTRQTRLTPVSAIAQQELNRAAATNVSRRTLKMSRRGGGGGY